jgi:integrase
VKVKRSSDDDEQRFKAYVYDLVGDEPIAEFALEHAERVMSKLPSHLSPASRRQVAQAMSRVLSLAHYPLKLRGPNPLPRGFLPKPGKGKAHTYLHPSEDAKLLAHTAAPLTLRVLYGFLAREGMRASEACGLRWSDVDLENGAVTLDENKTDDPRTWSLDAGVASALRIWRKMNPEAEHLFADEKGRPLDPARSNLAERLRGYLRAAGVTRAQLFEESATRDPLRAHDLRATFVTLALADGKSEAWVADRTGHKSSQMINRYRRAARSLSELGLGKLRPLCTAIPEIAAMLPKATRYGRRPSRRAVRRRAGHLWRSVVARHTQPPQSSTEPLVFLVGPVGIEPTTNGLKGPDLRLFSPCFSALGIDSATRLQPETRKASSGGRVERGVATRQGGQRSRVPRPPLEAHQRPAGASSTSRRLAARLRGLEPPTANAAPRNRQHHTRCAVGIRKRWGRQDFSTKVLTTAHLLCSRGAVVRRLRLRLSSSWQSGDDVDRRSRSSLATALNEASRRPAAAPVALEQPMDRKLDGEVSSSRCQIFNATARVTRGEETACKTI